MIRKTPRTPATIVTIIEAINDLCIISILKNLGKVSPGIIGASISKRGATSSRISNPIPCKITPPRNFHAP